MAAMKRWMLLAVVLLAGGCLQIMGWEEARPGWNGGSATAGAGGAGGSASSAAGSAGSGGAAACTPGETKSCYSGPEGTAGVGICRAGVMSCKADGSGFGGCAGEIGPQIEDYTKPEDEDCDGFAGSTTLWVTQIHNVKTTGIAADPSTGAVYVSGSFTGTATVGDKSFVSAVGKNDMLLAKLDGAGNVVWAQQLGNAAGALGRPIAFQNHALTVIRGEEVSVVAQPVQGFSIARYDEAGSVQWVSACVGQGSADISNDPTNDDAIVGGWFYALKCGQVYGAKADKDVFWSRLSSASGVGLKTRVFSSSFAAYARTIATDQYGGTLVGGSVDTGLDLGMVTIKDLDMFVARLRPDGTIDWAKDLGLGRVSSVATDDAGDLLIKGECGVYDAQSTPQSLPPFAAAGLCVAKLSGVDGSLLWARSFGPASAVPDQSSNHSIAVGPGGDVVLSGTVAGPLAVEEHTVTQSGFVASLDGATGPVRWVRSFGFDNPMIAFSTSGTMAVAATFGPGTSDFGKGQVTTAPMEADSVVFLIAP